MTTEYKIKRDITGATGNALSFSDLTFEAEIVGLNSHEFNIPTEYASYIIEVSAYPKTHVKNNIAIVWQYIPPEFNAVIGSPAYIITIGNRERRSVLGGSKVNAFKVRAGLIPPAVEPDVIVNIALYAEI